MCELAGEIGPVKVAADGKKFMEVVMADDTLKKWRELGDKKE